MMFHLRLNFSCVHDVSLLNFYVVYCNDEILRLLCDYRKMKNRIAAQTARDRKKAQMCDLEERIQRLEAENAALKAENVQLKTKSGKLNEENDRLKTDLNNDKVVAGGGEHVIKTEPAGNEIGIHSCDALGSAASISVPQQQEQATHGWILNWLLVVLTAMNSSNICNNSSELKKNQPLQITEIRNLIK